MQVTIMLKDGESILYGCTKAQLERTLFAFAAGEDTVPVQGEGIQGRVSTDCVVKILGHPESTEDQA